jgi:hypothetical protein
MSGCGYYNFCLRLQSDWSDLAARSLTKIRHTKELKHNSRTHVFYMLRNCTQAAPYVNLIIFVQLARQSIHDICKPYSKGSIASPSSERAGSST